ncbi:TATA box-binding protein 1 [Fasciola hepatica]|uniref:TATA box-binding protein 1 n=1 Tax=Fasciola hepatica TaxID=6192 RepID=A0A4E0R097_FASHE|nr:TATA box-binding protein 1 [Fasciola hepatica]
MASMRCHLRLKEIARSSVDVEYKALQNHVIMRLRSPYNVATIWSSGKIWCTGANSLAKAKVGARCIARRIAKCGFPCRFSRYKVVNIMATCHLPFRVRLEQLVRERPMMMSFEPELAPGLTFKTAPNSSTSLKLFSTGRIVIMGSSLETISALVEELVPLAALHQTDEPVSDSDAEEEQQKAELRAAARRMVFVSEGLPPDELGFVEDEEEDDPDVDEFASDSDESSLNAPTRYRAPPVYSTDDSTDSGASIDSGGMK